ncbi:hypothetical protein [Pedobacter sp. GR22-10]|uniref:hypothetical protein n=1 Tax=Pedobacter sp. GR22-10 TaxID=2994472 RepID=UPI002247E949|nr:hypothetical protein [Pedobacter sp. GR22-10]MCX2429902.1 hypothetical protein [Pedobacter sp. GR22-10]
MKRFKLMLSAAVLLAACSATAMAGTPKGETKDAKSEVTTTTTDNLHWYKVSYDNPSVYPNGYIKSGAPVQFTGDREGAMNENICPTGDTYDCLRGFSGTPSLPTENVGTDQVQTDEQP